MKRPPFTRQTAHCDRRSPRIFSGPDAWERACYVTGFPHDPAHMMAVLPPGEPPDLYDWSAFAGLDVIIETTEANEGNHALAIALILAGANMAVIVDVTGKSPTESYRPRTMEVAA